MNSPNRSASLRSPELMPAGKSERTMSLADYFILWAGMTINVVAFSLGAQYYNNGDGLSAWTMVFVILIGYGIVTALTALIGDIGTLYGVPFAVYARAPFGYKGSSIAGLLRAVPALYWFGFQTWVGAAALNYIMEILFGFSNLTLMIIAFAVFQVVNAMYGLKAMAKFDWIAIPALAILFVAIAIAIGNAYGVTVTDIMATKGNGNMSVIYAISGIAGGWITMALNGSDLARQIEHVPNYEKKGLLARNKRALIGQFFGLMVIGVICMLIGMAAGITTGEWDLNAICVKLFDSNFGLILALIAVVFAQWSTNTVGNLMPPSYVLISIFPKLNFKVASIICGVIAVAMQPWKIQNSGTFLVDMQVYISTMLGPVMGILLADYFIIRKCKLNVQDLYTAGGQYQYNNGFNMSAVIALVAGFGLSFISSTYAFFIGLLVAPVVYVVLMKNFTMKKHDQKIGQVIEFNEDIQ
ncbi:NCS1 family nucleobase:cation symporter-1 [Desulfitobacterium sp. LBE]|uniref:Permease for cytosine/purines uracil thiamine allantoin n=5 Tax=root TaxID=1 RepID=Q24WJ8_DESHY|nr:MULTISPECIES: cytosine permease [Desulfitobacterium]ACL20982.1 permease for cytosine/purines uracil thiamine allantoin [Desulfitobacterium hafniense DCB-2]KTE91254.1 thiamine permease [Desulfitobacterium hafniense]MEA5025407.1 cytosine permease [Desulfitobacterium hafniense]TWH56197.1 NCS1 family nucleobase:cation symporter-1 [Desulfitobacterium sp. LBE]CDX01868.1 Permease for cytosine/purines uracil thiamine allantoin [Desulfitobacterium hafniense]